MEDESHGSTRKYPDELRERATRMAVEPRADPATKQGAIARVAEQLGMHPEALRNWVRQAELSASRPETLDLFPVTAHLPLES
jgi:transposase